MSGAEPRVVPVLRPSQQAVLLALVLIWALSTGLFWAWWLQPSHWASPWGMAVNTVMLVVVTVLPAWTYVFLVQMQRVNPRRAFPAQLRLAMVVTKAPSEPWPLVQETLEAMLAQDPPHDTWLADEDPTPAALDWCSRHGVRVSSRRDAPGYHNPTWPRRRRCKEGNLAYFYDHYGYALYDVVVQLDADHRPDPGYLRAMVQPFEDPQVGYVAAPSICDRNAASSWVARGRLYAESVLHGPLQLGLNSGLRRCASAVTTRCERLPWPRSEAWAPSWPRIIRPRCCSTAVGGAAPSPSMPIAMAWAPTHLKTPWSRNFSGRAAWSRSCWF